MFNSVQTAPCPTCERNFAISSLAKHKKICKKVGDLELYQAEEPDEL